VYHIEQLIGIDTGSVQCRHDNDETDSDSDSEELSAHHWLQQGPVIARYLRQVRAVASQCRHRDVTASKLVS